MTTEAETTGWSDLNTYSTTGLLAHLTYLRQQRAYKEAANLIIEVRTYELRIAAAERMLAIHNRRATEAEDQRVAGERTLTEDRVRDVVRDGVLVTLEDQSATVTRNGCVLRYGTKERREALEFCADAIATRAAKELAGQVVAPAQRELQEWAIDVVFDGPPGPEAGRFVEVEDLSGKSVGVGQWIDRGNGLWALRIPRAHPAQREADLREAWITAIQWAFERSATEAEHARAAEYARSKAGG